LFSEIYIVLVYTKDLGRDHYIM